MKLDMHFGVCLCTLLIVRCTRANVLGHNSASNTGTVAFAKLSTGETGKDSKFQAHSNHANSASLVVAQLIFKYGDRSPIYPYKGNPYEDFDYGTVGKAKGQITPIGKQQMVDLGNYVRHRYKDFLSCKYNPDEIFVQSSDFDRAVTAVSSFLSGLYSKHYNHVNTSQLVPYHSLSPTVDNKIAATAPCACFERLYAEFQESDFIKVFNSELDPFAVAAAQSGQPYQDIGYMTMTDLYDTLKIQLLYDLKLPHWAAKVFDSALECAELQRVSEVYTPKMKRLKGGPLLTELLNNFVVNSWKAAAPSTLTPAQVSAYRKAKFYVYSGHDTTIAHLLYLLGNYNGRIPGYASALFLELHEVNGEKIVEIYYKEDWSAEIRQIDIPGCGPPCTLKNFKTRFADFLIDDATWITECNKDEHHPSSPHHHHS